MARPIASPPNRPVRMPIRVIPICTVDRKFSGFSASDRARAARLLAWASCLSRLLREVITDISDIAKKPLSRMRAKTISSSATRAYPAACMGGLLDGPGRQGAARSEEHTSELQSRENLVCRLLLEKKKKRQ